MLDVALDRLPGTGTRGRVEIVTADQSHAAGLLRLVAQAYAQEGQSWSGKPPAHVDEEITLEEVQAMIAAPRARLLAALDGEAVIGCVLVTRLNRERSALGLLGVDSECRRRGLGARLIAAAERAAGETFGSTQIELCVLAERRSLVSYYERHGFHSTGEQRTVRASPVPMHFSVMAKALS